jgi:hypothetical protein
MVPCVSIDWPFLRRAAPALLPLLFVPLSAADAVASVAAGWLGIDAHLYYQASAAWLAGGNPWDIFVTNRGTEFHYYALPTATVLLAPFTLIPEHLFVPGAIVAQFAAAGYVIRRLGLPWWWLAFPPIVKGVLTGNPSLVLLALLLASNPIANAIAPLVKVYAGVPLIGERRWRAIVLAAAFGLLTVLVAPGLWGQFMTDPGTRADRLLVESYGGYSAVRYPVLLVGAILAVLLIARRDMRTAAWLAPIALWPGSQFHWSILALPVMTLPMSFLLALPGHGLPAVAVMLHAAITEARHLRSRRREERSGS